MKTAIFASVLAAASLTVPAAPAFADPPSWAPAHGKRAKDRARYQERHYEPRRMSRGDRYWRGSDGHYHCERSDGTTGLIIGAAGGALIGREVDGGRDRTVGTVLGAAAGALIGKAIDQGGARCR